MLHSVKSSTVSIVSTLLNEQLCKIYRREGFIDSFRENNSNELILFLKYKRNKNEIFYHAACEEISKPGNIKIYSNQLKIFHVFSMRKMGIVILSTSQRNSY